MPDRIFSIGVTEFIDVTYSDLIDSQWSKFIQKINVFKRSVDIIQSDLDADIKSLKKIRKCVKSICVSGKVHIQNDSQFSTVLGQLSNDAIEDGDDSIGSALTKFSVVSKETSIYFSTLVQNLANIVLSPLDTFLRTEGRQEPRKCFEKAFKEYENKYEKIKKEKQQLVKEIGVAKTDVSIDEIQDELEYERRCLQLQLCEVYIKANDVKTKKHSSLLQHLIDFYTAQLTYYRECLKTLEHLGVYMENMVQTVEELRGEQEEERKSLIKLRDELKKTLTEKDVNASEKSHRRTSSASGATGGYSLHQASGNPNVGWEKSGYLFKRSEGKVKKVWQKRRAAVEGEHFVLHHADENKLPVRLMLLTCQVRPESGGRAFALISNNRTYHFQCDTVLESSQWVSVLHNAKEKVFQAAMGAPERTTLPNKSLSGSLRGAIIQEIKALPGNDKCADCSAPDPEWISTNLGILICLECCGIHRELGVHLSRTQSLTMDDLTTAQLLISRFVGNGTFNDVFEAVLPDKVKPKFCTDPEKLNDLMEARKLFIRAKYIERFYVCRTTIPQDAKETLSQDVFKAVQLQDISLLIQGFAEGADLFSSTGVENETPMHQLLREGEETINLALVDFALQNSPVASLRRVNSYGETILHYCVNYNRPECLKLCLRTGLSASVGARNMKGLSPLEIAEELGYTLCSDLFYALEENNVSLFENISNFDWSLSCIEDQPDYMSDEDAETPTGAPVGTLNSSGEESYPQLRTLNKRKPRATSYLQSPMKQNLSDNYDTSSEHSASSQSQQGYSGSGFVTLPRKSSKIKKAPPPPMVSLASNGSNNSRPVTRVSSLCSSRMMSSSMHGSEAFFKSPMTLQHRRNEHPAKQRGPRRAGSYDNIDVIIDALLEEPPETTPSPVPRHSLHKAVPDSSPLASSSPVQQSAKVIPPKRSAKPKIDKSLLQKTSTMPASSVVKEVKAPIASSDSDVESLRQSLPSSPLAAHNKDGTLKAGIRCQAMYNCNAEFSSELSFRAGEVIRVLRKENDDWWEGEIENEPGRRGLFPVSFVHFMS